MVLDLVEYEAQQCRGCGGPLSITSDDTMARDVRDAKVICWDCDSIEKHRQALHAKHDKDDCDCDSLHIWVEGYSERPPR